MLNAKIFTIFDENALISHSMFLLFFYPFSYSIHYLFIFNIINIIYLDKNTKIGGTCNFLKFSWEKGKKVHE